MLQRLSNLGFHLVRPNLRTVRLYATTMSAKQYPQTIKAIQYTGVGGPEVIKVNEVPFPNVAADEILIKIQWSGVNFIDIYFRNGTYPLRAIPWTAGQEAAGVIEQLPQDPQILNNPDYKARNYQVGQTVAFTNGVAYAEYVSKPWIRVLPVPSNVSARDAAAASLQGLTALTFIEEAYHANEGDYVLVHAAAGGLGLNLCQLLSAKGVHVIGSVSSEQKAQLAKENGAEFVIIYTKEDLVKRVAEITNGEGVHGIYDGVGKSTWESNFETIRRKGTIVTFGNASGVVPDFSPMKLKPKNLHLARPEVGNYLVTPAEITHYSTGLFEALGSGKLKVHVFKEYPFTAEGVAEAQAAQASGKTTGKLIIKVSD